MPEQELVLVRDARGSLVHVKDARGRCLGCVEAGLFELLRTAVLAEQAKAANESQTIELDFAGDRSE